MTVSTFRTYWLFFLGYQLHGLIWRDDNTIGLPDTTNLILKLVIIAVSLFNMLIFDKYMYRLYGGKTV